MPPLPDDEEARRRAKIEADIKANEEAARARNAARLASAKNLETFNPPVLGASPVRSGARYEEPDLSAGSPEPERRYVPPVDDPIRDAPEVVASPRWDPSLAIPAAQDGSGIFGVGSGGPEDPVPGPLTEAQVIQLKQWKDNRDAGVQSFEMRQRLMDGADPEAAARALELSQRTGASRLEVQSDPEGYSRLDLMSQVDKLRETSPRTLTWLNAYPDNFDIAHDDTESLGWWEQAGTPTFEEFGASVKVGTVDRTREQFFGAVQAGTGIARLFEWIPGVKGLLDAGDEEARKQRIMAAIDALGSMPEGDTDFEKGIYGAGESAPSSVISMLISMATKSPVTGPAALGTMTAGGAYGEAEDAGKPFMDRMRYAITQGGIEAGTEMIPMQLLMGDLAKETPFAKTFFRNVVSEGLTEQAATFLQDASTWLELNPDKTISEFFAERPSAAIQTLVASSLMSGVQTTIAKGVDTAVQRVDTGAQQRRAEEIANMVRAMGDKAADSKLLKRMPDKYREAVASITKDGPLENIRVDGEAFNELAQEKGVTVERLAQAFRIDPADAAMAIETGQDVVIPSGNYAAVIQTGKKELGIAGTEIHTALAPNIRLRADDFTAKEAAAMKQVVADEQAARESDEAGVSFASAADRVREDSRQTLAATGRFNAETTAVQSAIPAELIITLAERTNQDPEKLWADYKASVESSIKGDQDELSQGGDRAAVEVDDDTLQRASERLTEYEFAVWKAATLEGRTNSDIADDAAIEELRLKQYVTRSEKDAMPSREGISVVLNRAKNKGFPAPQAQRGRGDAIKDDVKRLIKIGLTSKQIHERLGRPPELRNSTNAQVSKIKKEMREAGELAQSKSLPMDEASRMQRAREMGFDVDTPLYHGTERGGFDSFDASRSGSNTGKESVGIFLTESPLNASTYAGTHKDKIAKISEYADFDPKYDGERGIYKVYIRPGDQQVVDWGGANWDMGPNGLTIDDAAAYAKQAGYDSLRVINIIDEGRHGQGYGWGNETIVVFDPKNIRTVDAAFDPSQEGSSKLLAQDQTENRGGFTGMNLSQEAVIRLYESANLSTFVHETAHWYLTTLEKMARLPDAQPFVIEQLASIRNWAGKHPEFEIYDANGQITPEGVEVHESFAETFEAYLREGKAPSTAMRSVFAAFKSWLMRVYRSIAEIGGRVRLDAEITAVFDRALATDEAIAAVRKGMDQNAEKMAKAMLDKGVITQRQYDRTKARLVEAKEKAEADLMARLMEQYERNQKVWWREEERDVRRDVQSEIDERPEQRAYQVFTGEGWRDTLEDHVEKAAREQLELAQEQGLFEPNANDDTLRILQMRAVEQGLGPLILLFKTTSGRIIAFPGESGTMHHDLARQMLGLGNLKLQHGMYNPRKWPTIEAMNADPTGAAWYATTGEQADVETRELAHRTYSADRHAQDVRRVVEFLKVNPDFANGPLSRIMTETDSPAYAADRGRRLFRRGDELKQGEAGTVVYRGSAEDEAGVTENGRLGLGLYSAEDPEIGAEWGGATGKVEAYRINGRLFDLDETTAEGLENYERQEDTPAAKKLFARLKSEGYVGIRDPWSGHINVFDAKDMIRAPDLDTELGDTWTNDPELGQAAGRDAGAQGELGQSRQLDAMGFYSALREAVANSPQAKASAAQWKATLSKMPGVKAEEIEWTGVNDWLDAQEGQVTREALAGFLASNGVKVEEVTKNGDLGGDKFYFAATQDEDGIDTWGVFTDNDGLVRYEENEYDAADFVASANAELEDARETKFDTFTLPGGEDYTELLLTLPNVDGPATHWDDPNVVAHARFKTRYAPVPTTEQEEADNRAWNDAQPAIDVLRDEVRALSAQRARELQDGGYAYDREPPSTPSLAPLQAAVDKLRAAEAALPKPIDRNRRQKVLALEEIQSDWHQKGRTEGYAGVFDQKKLDAAQEKLDAALAARAAAKVELEQFLLADSSIAAAVIRLKESPNFAGRSDGDIARHAFQTGTRLMSSQANFQATELDKVTQTAYLREREAGLARDAARSPGGIPNAPFKNNGWVNLVLKRMIRYAAENGFDSLAWVPGSVQNGNEVEADDNRADFYDKIVPNAANKLGKKYEAQVSQIGIRLQGRDTGRPVDRQTFWALPITPQLKAAAMEGMPLFHTRTRPGRIAPPPSIPPMRLDLRAVEEQYGPEALAALPPRVRAHSASATDADQFVALARDVQATLKKKVPRSLSKFLSNKRTIGEGNDKITYSGIRDPDGEILAMIGKRGEARGLIATPENDSKKSRSYSYEEAAQAAWEEGYFNGESPPSPAEFLDALRADIDGTAKLYKRDDVEKVQQIADANEWANWFDQNEIDINEENDAVLRAAIETKLSGQGEGAIGPDEAAPFFKMADGRALLEGLKQGPQRDKLIREETRRRMIERHGDIFNDGTIMEAARAFAANEVQQRQYEIELEALSNASGKQAAANLARETAKELLRDKQVREVLDYNQWLILSERWGKKALEAAEKGDFAKAAEAKRYQIINMAMFREGRKLAEKIESTRKHLLDYGSKTKRSRLLEAGPEYLEQMTGLLDDYQFRPESRKGENKRRARGEWVRAQMAALDPYAAYQDATKTDAEKQVEAAEALERSQMLANLAEGTEAKNFKSITVDELLSVRDEADMIWRLATLKDRLIKEGERRRLSLAAGDIAAEIETNQPNEKPPEPAETDSPGYKLKRSVFKYFAMHRTLQSLARQFAGDKDNGVFWRYIVRPLNEAFARLSSIRKEMGADVDKLFSTYTKDEQRRMFRDRQTFDFRQSGGPRITLSKQGRMAFALNWGNAKNRQRLMDSLGIDAGQVQQVLNTLDRRDWDFIQATWDYLDTWFPEANRVHESVHGAPMDKEAPLEIATRFGIYKGGYYPIKFDPMLSSKTGQRQMEADAKTFTGQVGARSTPSFANKRVKGKVTLPLRLSVLDVITSHLDQVAVSIATEEALFDAGRLIKQPAVENAIIERHGREIYNTIVNTLVTAKFGLEGANGVLAHLRNGATVVGLGWKVSTALLQPLGISNSIVRVGGFWIAKGYARMGKDAATIQSSANWIMERSEFMRNRRQSNSPEMQALRGKLKAGVTDIRIPGVVMTKGAIDAVKNSAFAMMANTQFYSVDMPTWYGAYFKAKAAGMSEADAYAEADQAVIDSQGGGELHQTAAMQTGAGTRYAAALRLLTNFMSYMVTTYNLSVMRIRSARTIGQIAALGFDLAIMLAVPVAGKMMLDAWTKGGDDDEDELWEKYMREQAAFLLSPFVGISQIAGTTRGEDSYGYRGPAGLGIFAEATNAGKAFFEADFDESFWRPANKTAGMIFHYPAGQLDATIRGAMAYFNGETENPAAFLVGPPPAN